MSALDRDHLLYRILTMLVRSVAIAPALSHVVPYIEPDPPTTQAAREPLDDAVYASLGHLSFDRSETPSIVLTPAAPIIIVTSVDGAVCVVG